VIPSLDPVGPGQRMEPIYLEGRGPLVDAEQARILGLRNGQVVQAVIDRSGSTFSVLWPAGQRGGLPTALEAFPLPSQWRWAAGSSQELVALLMPGGFIQLRPVKTGSASAAVALPERSLKTPAGPIAPPAPSGLESGPAVGRYTLGQAFAWAQGLLPGVGAGGAAAGAAGGAGLASGASAELARLMQQAPAWASLMGFLRSLMPGDADEDSALAGETAPPPAAMGSRLADLLGAPLPRLASLSPSALQQAMARSGLGTEAALLAGAAGLDQDLKVALRRLQRSLPPGTPVALDSSLGRSVDTLERSQIDTLTAQLQGQVLLSMVIPFADAGPVALRVFRDRARGEGEPPPFVVDVHSGHSSLGPLWLRTQVAHDRRVSMTMWALLPEVAHYAREQSRALRLSLSQSGLVLSSLEIVAGAPQADDVAFSDGGLKG